MLQSHLRMCRVSIKYYRKSLITNFYLDANSFIESLLASVEVRPKFTNNALQHFSTAITDQPSSSLALFFIGAVGTLFVSIYVHIYQYTE